MHKDVIWPLHCDVLPIRGMHRRFRNASLGLTPFLIQAMLGGVIERILYEANTD